jgi:hypothetical protein
VRDLSQRIHLIGLNAQVQAAQVEAGFALEVLSARTSEISRATTHISESVASHLDELVRGLADGVKELEALQSAALTQQSTLASEGATAEHSLHALRDEALAMLLDLNTLLENIQSGSEALTGAIDFIEMADAPLADLQGKLQNIAEIAGRMHVPDRAKPEAVLSQFRNRYTMNSERKVFASVVDGQTGSAVPEAIEGVELFDDPAPVTSANIAAAPKPLRSDNMNTISFSEPPARPADSATPGAISLRATPPGELGSNVELF